MSDPETIGALLEELAGHGIYDIALVQEQVTKFGFAYDYDTDRLIWRGVAIPLGSMTYDDYVIDMASDPKGGIMDSATPPDTRMIDALALSAAIHHLLLPSEPLPSSRYSGRGKGFRMNVAAIQAFEKANKEVN